MMEDNQLKNILKDSQLKAKKHFTDKVMHQIEMEQALMPKKKKIFTSPSYTTLGVFGVMYLLILLTACFLYSSLDSNLLNSSTFLKISGLIASICGVFYLITVFDETKSYHRKP